MLVALALRLGYMWQFQHIHPRQGVSVIPFLFESGNIAHSLATGHGFSSPFRVDTGPTAWMTPLFPLLLAGIFRIFGAYTFHAWAATVLFNITCCTLACIPIYFTAKRIGGIALAAGAAWLWAIFPNAILIPVESMWDACISALLVATILWATLALAESQRLRNWCAYGLLWGIALMFNATLAALFPFLAGWLVYRRDTTTTPMAHKCGSCSRDRHPLLRAVDHPQLLRVPPIRSAALRPGIAALARQQRSNPGHFSRRSSPHLQFLRAREIHRHG